MIFNYPIFRTRENFVHMVKNPYLEAQKSLCRVSAIFTLSKFTFESLKLEQSYMYTSFESPSCFALQAQGRGF